MGTDEERAIGLFMGGNANFQVPVKFQLALLGLDEETIKRLKGKTGLDIACEKGLLVKDLRKKGILFEGIDSKAPEGKPYFIIQNVTNVQPIEGSIPKEDDFYDIVTAFQCHSLNRGFTMGGVLRTAVETAGTKPDDWHTTRYKHAQSIIYEATRVAKPGCRVIAYPGLTRLEEVMGPLLRLQDIDIYTEPVDKTVAEAYLEIETPLGINLPKEYSKEFGLLERTVLVKNKC